MGVITFWEDPRILTLNNFTIETDKPPNSKMNKVTDVKNENDEWDVSKLQSEIQEIRKIYLSVEIEGISTYGTLRKKENTK